VGSRSVGKEKKMVAEHALRPGRDYRERGHICAQCLHFIDAPVAENRFCLFEQKHVASLKEACRYFAISKRKRMKKRHKHGILRYEKKKAQTLRRAEKQKKSQG